VLLVAQALVAHAFDATVAAEGVDRVALDLRGGNVRVVADAEGHVRVRGEPTAWPDGCAVTQTAEAGTVRVVVTGGSALGPCLGNWEVHVAPSMALDLRAGGGNVSIPALTGAVSLSVGAGDVTLTDLGGPLTARIEAGLLGGTFVGPSADVEMGTGGIHLTNLVGPVRAVAKVGDVSLAFLVAPAGDVAARTSLGSVRVSLPAGSAVDVAAGPGVGKKRIDLPHTPGARTRVRVESKVGTVWVGAVSP
jgi:hypothetical protein